MISKTTLWWGAAVIVALTGGFLSGVWAGAKTEQDALVDLLWRANLTADCQDQIDRAVKEIIGEWETKPEAPSP